MGVSLVVTREGSIAKRRAIETAAQVLFVRDGVAQTGMDSIAHRAEVSKRTIYDYYGSKDALLLTIIEQAGTRLLAVWGRALEEHLDSKQIGSIPELEAALVAFSLDVSRSVLGSIDYSTVRRLIRDPAADSLHLKANPLDSAAEASVATRLDMYRLRGLLEIDDLPMAADHLLALTAHLVVAHSGDWARTEEIVLAGVRAFIRSYRVVSGGSRGASSRRRRQ